MLDEKIHIDLHLPRGWNQCTTEELETIAATMMRHTLLADRYHPFDWLSVKTELFFLLSGVEIVESGKRKEERGQNNSLEDGEYLCRLKDKRGSKLFTIHYSLFTLKTWQVHSWIDQHLAWLDDDKAQQLLIFPYKQLIYTRRWPWQKKHYLAPAELLQDFSWQEYRHLQDYMELYVKTQNQMVQMQQGVTDLDRLAQLEQQAEEAKRNFLKVLFRIDAAAANSSLFTFHSSLRAIGPIQWQVILFWWSGFMHYLQQKFPRCFKPASTKKPKFGKNQATTPLDFYVSITATMQKYLQLDEDKVNAQTFYLTLEQLERIAKENEEMEKISKKHK